MATVFQIYFTTFQLNPGYEKQISNIRDTLQTGIQFGYSSDTEGSLKYVANDHEYSIMQKLQLVCVRQSVPMFRTSEEGRKFCLCF